MERSSKHQPHTQLDAPSIEQCRRDAPEGRTCPREVRGVEAGPIEDVESLETQLCRETLSSLDVFKQAGIPVRDARHFDLIASCIARDMDRYALRISRIIERSLVQVLRRK